MTLHRFHYGPSVVSGTGASRTLSETVTGPRLLFVTDQALVSLGLAQPVIAALEAAGREVIIFDRVEADPSVATLEAAVELGRRKWVDAVIGFGGGSPMDIAKLAAYLLGSGEAVDDLWGVGKAAGRRLPLVLVPTTAGTGSEATPVAIITVADGEKRGVSARSLVADHAILDAGLTLGLPVAVTAATGIDAMVHAIEAYTSLHLKNPLSDMLAREALGLLGSNLLSVCVEPGNAGAREAMLLGSHLAGVAFANAPVGGVHALAYPLGGRFHVPHGLANALMLPHVLAFNAAAASHLYADLAPILDPALAGLDRPTAAEKLIETLGDLIERSGLPRRLRDVGVAAHDLDGLADDAMLQERLLRNNPRLIARDDARGLYQAAW